MLDDGELDRRTRQRAYENLCSSVLAASIPGNLVKVVSDLAEESLRSVPVGLAVRSSGIQEDLEKAQNKRVIHRGSTESRVETYVFTCPKDGTRVAVDVKREA